MGDFLLAYPARLELATFGVGGQHSIQLSYGYIILNASEAGHYYFFGLMTNQKKMTVILRSACSAK